MDNEFKLEDFKLITKRFLIEILHSAEHSHEIAFGKNREIDDMLAGVMINDATSYANSLKVLYYQNPDFEHNEFDDFFHAYDVYKHEILDNIRTKHSHQWTDIEFLKLIKSTVPLAQLLELDVDRYIKKYL